ncbi:MAG: alpha/beta fold hydrolase [Solirubrobacterales bacterium]
MPERAEANGVELAYQRRGDGPAVVFVHGLGGRKEAWAEVQAAAAEAGYEAIALDLRGAGDSDKPAGPYSVEGWSRDLIALLEALGIGRAALVGHSVGCMVVEHAALALEDRCPALAMLGGAVRWAEGFDAVLAERARLARGGRMREIAEAVAGTGLTDRARAEDPALVERFIEMFAANDPDGYAESCLATARGAMLDPERVACPALAFAGALDAVTPPGASKEIAAAMPHGQFETVPEGAHWCHVEAPGAVSEPLLGFLGRVAIG